VDLVVNGRVLRAAKGYKWVCTWRTIERVWVPGPRGSLGGQRLDMSGRDEIKTT